jgi:uncharacterized protein YdaU (DUF1376 family)
MPSHDRPPAFLFNPRIFLSDAKVALMSTKAIGAYLLILCHSYEDEPGVVPDDDRVLARWGRLTPEEWKEEGPCVRNAFALHPHRVGMLVQKRMALEYQIFLEKNRKKSDAGRAAADKRWRKYGKNQRLTTDANALPTQCDGNATAMPTPMPKNANNNYNLNTPPIYARAKEAEDCLPSEIASKDKEKLGASPAKKNGHTDKVALESTSHAPTLEQVLAFSAKSNWPWTRDVMEKAFRSFEATKTDGYWMFGNRRATDWRAAFQVRCQDYAERSAKPTAGGAARSGRRAIDKPDYEDPDA